MNTSLVTWLRWLALAAKPLVLSSISAVLVGLVTVTPQLFSLAHAVFPPALSYVVMRWGSHMAVVEAVQTVLMVAYPTDLYFRPRFIIGIVPLVAAITWATNRRTRAASRWRAALAAPALGDIARGLWSIGYVSMTLRLWALQPATEWAAKLPDTFVIALALRIWGEIMLSEPCDFDFLAVGAKPGTGDKPRMAHSTFSINAVGVWVLRPSAHRVI
jgi:hypothetical protein